MKQTIRRLGFTVSVLCFVLTIGTQSAEAFGVVTLGQPKSGGGRDSKHGDSPDGLTAEVMIDDGPADAICVARRGEAGAPSVRWEEPPRKEDVQVTQVFADRLVPGSDPPRYEPVLIREDTVYIRRWKLMTLSCAGTTRTVRVCVPGPGQPTTVCPDIKKPDGRTVARHNMDFVPWPDIHPQFAPNVASDGPNNFAITQAPLFFWVSDEDWAARPTATAQACNAAGCITSITQGRPIAVGLVPGVDDSDIACPSDPGRPITSAAAYEDARRDGTCHMYTYKHSSTTVGGSYKATVYLDYQVWIGAVDEDDFRNNVAFAADAGNQYTTFIQFDLKVGEIEAVVK
jgi:hypothetical protein